MLNFLVKYRKMYIYNHGYINLSDVSFQAHM